MKRILIVDDEPDHRLLLRDMLEANDYLCEEAADGTTALKVLATTPIDLVLTDLNMPGMNGVELIAHLMGSRRSTMLPIILVTSEDLDSMPAFSLKERLFAILSKPYRLGSLLTAVEEATEDPVRLVALSH